MKRYIRIALTLLIPAFFAVSCEDSEPETGEFGLDTDTISMEAEGGTADVRIRTSGRWIAQSEATWLSVSPVNGTGSVDCRIRVDSALLADEERSGVIRFISDERTEQLVLKVSQSGFKREIRLADAEVDIPNFESAAKRVFDVDVTANVPFKVDIPADVKWVSCPDPKFESGHGARPRTVRLRFSWESNFTEKDGRKATISFSPKEEGITADADRLVVSQEAAPVIEDNRQGDSLAIVAIATAINASLGDNDGERLDNWSYVTVWHDTDDEVEKDPSLLGRVRSVRFQMFTTNEEIPPFVQYLTKAEDIQFVGNANVFMRTIPLGENISKLTQLKKLTIYSYGLVDLNDSFANLKNLEYLDLGDNNFNKLPDVLTPENFPNLTYLSLSSQRRNVITNFQSTTRPREEWGGMPGTFPERLLHWEKLEYLGLAYNYMWGPIPACEDGSFPVYTEEEVMKNDTLPNGSNNPARYNLIGKPKVLPNARVVLFNQNMFDGEIPEWVLYHPHLMEWYPDMAVFPQSDYVNLDGKTERFTNVPVSPDYYYEAYPLKKPEGYDD